MVEFRKLCVLGLGYIGLPTASTFATHGLKVVGVDINPDVVEALREGDLHIHEPGLRTLVQAAFRSGNLVVQSEPESADAYIISVPTPFLDDKRADLSYVISAAEAIAPHLSPGNLVVLESTSPPRTTIDILAPILERSGLSAGEDFYLAYSPERVLPGQILRELIENARVIGGINSVSAKAGKDLFSLFVRGDILLTDATTAEMVKLMENTYRDINIAIANEFSQLADRFKIDAWEAIEIANRHPRVHILNPGPGVGGHCISVDPWFLVESARELTPLIQAARHVNDKQPEYVVELVKRALGGSCAGRAVALLGLTYKADVDDMRESPAVDIAQLLIKAGADVAAYEPSQRGKFVEGIQCRNSLEDTLGDAELLLLLVGHQEMRQLRPIDVAKLTSARVVVDAVNAWDTENWARAGFIVHRLGSGKEIVDG
jgi:UDP-N-acetyl-D-mannosaminuronic acid dehydrogenase